MQNSEIIIGCMSWGEWGKKMSIGEQADLITFCCESGNTRFDHADIYGNYTTEQEFGNAWRQSGIKRENIQLITKCGIQMVGEARANRIKHYDYSKEYIIWSAEQSLKNLQTDYMDTFLLHRPSPLMEVSEIAEAIAQLKEQGKIRNFGVSNFTPLQCDLLSTEIKLSSNQIEFSLASHQAMKDGSLDYMQAHEIKPMAWAPLGKVFQGEGEQKVRIRKVLGEMSLRYGVSEDVVLLAWILRHPANIAPVIGTTIKERILNANKALELRLALQDWFILLEASTGHKVA